jgi:hypothetical protein
MMQQDITIPVEYPISYIFVRFQAHSFHLEYAGSKVLRNYGILSHHYTASQPRRPRLDPGIITIVEQRKLRLVEPVALMGETRNEYRMFVERVQLEDRYVDGRTALRWI